jgi:hypothetical protein
MTYTEHWTRYVEYLPTSVKLYGRAGEWARDSLTSKQRLKHWAKNPDDVSYYF